MESKQAGHSFSTKTTYPCLKISQSTGEIVLFTKLNCGILIYSENNLRISELGYHSNNWLEEKIFVTFDGIVTLKN